MGGREGGEGGERGSVREGGREEEREWKGGSVRCGRERRKEGGKWDQG